MDGHRSARRKNGGRKSAGNSSTAGKRSWLPTGWLLLQVLLGLCAFAGGLLYVAKVTGEAWSSKTAVAVVSGSLIAVFLIFHVGVELFRNAQKIAHVISGIFGDLARSIEAVRSIEGGRVRQVQRPFNLKTTARFWVNFAYAFVGVLGVAGLLYVLWKPFVDVEEVDAGEQVPVREMVVPKTVVPPQAEEVVLRPYDELMRSARPDLGQADVAWPLFAVNEQAPLPRARPVRPTKTVIVPNNARRVPKGPMEIRPREFATTEPRPSPQEDKDRPFAFSKESYPACFPFVLVWGPDAARDCAKTQWRQGH
jgi:hypothetical protein